MGTFTQKHTLHTRCTHYTHNAHIVRTNIAQTIHTHCTHNMHNAHTVRTHCTNYTRTHTFRTHYTHTMHIRYIHYTLHTHFILIPSNSIALNSNFIYQRDHSVVLVVPITNLCWSMVFIS